MIYLYTSGNDPWQQNSPSCGLYEFGRYWNDNRSQVDRTFGPFHERKEATVAASPGSGFLCRNSFNVNIANSGCSSLAPNIDNYGGDYGYSGSLSGSFSISNPRAVWDMVVVTHEIGHNFNSPHTHSYCNIGGNSQPVDQCIPPKLGSGLYRSLPVSFRPGVRATAMAAARS